MAWACAARRCAIARRRAIPRSALRAGRGTRALAPRRRWLALRRAASCASAAERQQQTLDGLLIAGGERYALHANADRRRPAVRRRRAERSHGAGPAALGAGRAAARVAAGHRRRRHARRRRCGRKARIVALGFAPVGNSPGVQRTGGRSAGRCRWFHAAPGSRLGDDLRLAARVRRRARRPPARRGQRLARRRRLARRHAGVARARATTSASPRAAACGGRATARGRGSTSPPMIDDTVGRRSPRVSGCAT